jgi:uncharacterized protein YfkK (UPF0435 family)
MPETHKFDFMEDNQVILKNLPKYHHFQGVFKEIIDIHLFDLLIKKGKWNNETLRSLTTLYNSINKKNNVLSVSYEYAGGKCGRFYPKYSKSIVCMHKKAKHTIFHYQGYSDLDMVKGHPTIAVEMARVCDMEPLHGVEWYINNFDKAVKAVSEFYSGDKNNPLDEGDVKRLFNSIIYGGGVAGWKKDLADASKHDSPKMVRDTIDTIDVVENFKNDIVRFNAEIYKKNTALVRKVNADKKGDRTEYDKKGTTASYWFQIVENHILYIVVDYLLMKGIMKPKCYRLEFDGICIPPFKIDYDKDKLTEEINNHVYEMTGLNILFKFKNYKPENVLIDLIDERSLMGIAPIDADEDADGDKVILPMKLTKLARDVVLDRYNGKIVRCDGMLYVKYDDVWISDVKMVDDVLMEWMRVINIWYYTPKGVEMDYTGDVDECVKIIKDIRTCLNIIDNDFIKNANQKNKNYLPFKNGIYSFVDKKLYSYDEKPDIHFFIKIDRTLPGKKNENDYKELMERVIIPIYPDAIERDFNAHCKARALGANFEDKVWNMYIGSRNSGKGVETELLKNAFGGYVASFDSSCLIYTKEGRGKDPAKELGWVLEHMNARMLMSSEIRGKEGETVLDGGLIKMLASGGDAIGARKLYNNAKNIVPQFTMFMCCNAYYPCDPDDATENLLQFDYKSKFVDAEDLIEGVSYLKLKDDKIKSLVNEKRIIDAYTWYILDAFKEVREKAPDAIKNAILASKPDVKETLEQFILKRFKTTGYESDKLHTDMICSYVSDAGFSASTTTVSKTMARVGIGKKEHNCTIVGVKKAGYSHIRFIDDDEWKNLEDAKKVHIPVEDDDHYDDDVC